MVAPGKLQPHKKMPFAINRTISTNCGKRKEKYVLINFTEINKVPEQIRSLVPL